MRRPDHTVPSSPESGAALITVVMMVAMLSALAIAVVEAARFSVRRTANLEQMEQTRWHLLGAEAYATSLIDRATAVGETSAGEIAASLDRPVTLPVDGGAIQITVWDGSNCFNLNSVTVRSEEGRLLASPEGIARFALLLELSGVQSSQTLAAALADWIDNDEQPLPGGAEGLSYGGEDAAFRPPNTLILDTSDLSHVLGFDADVVSRIGRLVCVRPTEAPNAINVETLRPDQAQLLAAMVGRSLSLAAAEQVIADRPADGWTLIDAFLNHPRLIGLGLSDETKAQMGRTSEWYVVGAAVTFQDVSETSTALVRANSGHGRVVRRVFGASVRERAL